MPFVLKDYLCIIPEWEERGVRAVFTTRRGGVSPSPYDTLNLAFHTGDNPTAVSTNRGLLCRRLGIRPSQLASLNQVHGDRVLLIRNDQDLASRGIVVPVPGGTLPADPSGSAERSAVWPPEADAQITALPGVALLCLVADCAAVYIFDPVRRVIALAHAGWRGMVAGIAAKSLAMMKSEYGTRPEDCLGAISPCAGPCCYEVGEDVAQQVRRRFPGEWELLLRPTRPGHWKLDLGLANVMILQEAGVKRENIVVSRWCTICHHGDLFFSHRGNGGVTGRMGAILIIDQGV